MMKKLFVGIVLAATVASAMPASAQRIDIGPGGPSIDMRSRGERARDERREDYLRESDRDRRMYRQERYDDRGERSERRGNGY